MKSTITIDMGNPSDFSIMNAATNTNELWLYIIPESFQKTNIRLEINSSEGQLITGPLITELGETEEYIDYQVPIKHWQKAGEMQARLLSDEGNSDNLIKFYTPVAITGDVRVKFESNTFMIIEPNNENVTYIPSSKFEEGVEEWTGNYWQGKKLYRYVVPEFQIGQGETVKDIQLQGITEVWIDMQMSYFAMKSSDSAYWDMKPFMVSALNTGFNIETAVFRYVNLSHLRLSLKVGSNWSGNQFYVRAVLLYTKDE